MKRKIRKKRQVRLQNFKEQKERNKYDNEWYAKGLIKLFNSHPYWIAASLSYYAFIYIDFHFGWEMYRPIKLMILYDRMSQDIKYGIFMVEFSEDPDDFSYKTSFKEIGSRHMEEIIFIDDMLTFDPQNITCHFDVSSYEIIIKSGSQQRFVYIQSPEKDKYGPFKWLFDLTAEIREMTPRECNTDEGWVIVGG